MTTLRGGSPTPRGSARPRARSGSCRAPSARATLPSTPGPPRYPERVKHRLRSAAAVAISVVSLSGVAGCAVFSPPTVLRPYVPSDGLSSTVGDVAVRNALIVSSAPGQPGVVSAALVNSGEQSAQVTVTVETGSSPTSASFTVAPGTSFTIGSGSGAADLTGGDVESDTTGWLQLPTVTEVPGALVPMTFAAGGATATVNAPIVRPCFAYANLTPTPSSSPSASAGASPTTAAESTPSPTLNCQPEVGEDEVQGESDTSTTS